MKIRLGTAFPGSGLSGAFFADRIKMMQLPKALKSNYSVLLTVTNWFMGVPVILFALVLVRDIAETK